eukprot:277645_1
MTDSFTMESLQMYSTLINMGFEDGISIEASKKFPNNADEAIGWITEQESNTNTQSSPIGDPYRQPLCEQKSQSAPNEELTTWITGNKFSKNIVAALKQHDVESLEDLKLLQSDQEINQFAEDLGLNIVSKRKFFYAIKQLQSKQIPKTDVTQYNPYQKQQQQPNIYNQYQQNYNPYSSNNDKTQIFLHDNNDEKDDIKLSDEEIKKQKRQKLVAHLKGDVQ